MAAPTISGRQGRHREVRSGRFAEPEANLQFEEHKSEEAVRQSERLLTARFEVQVLGEEPLLKQTCL